MSYNPTPQMNTYPPQQSQQVTSKNNTWKHDLFSCFGDIGLCIVTTWFPCITYGQNSEKLGGSCVGNCLLYSCIPCCLCVFVTTKRSEIRNRQGIDGSCMGDFCTHFFCHCCALIQEGRELQ
ncbi:283_t:CDS:2 [Scutellospora calospora]|uniref:283_t:CDS:1 n=1 Tax=Scutellospora calospora TaxID=85575 RepID=A0ACA9LEJ0_9GLOM|nr:283_t:CDS:2 [Scutellospora calospora]